MYVNSKFCAQFYFKPVRGRGCLSVIRRIAPATAVLAVLMAVSGRPVVLLSALVALHRLIAVHARVPGLVHYHAPRARTICTLVVDLTDHLRRVGARHQILLLLAIVLDDLAHLVGERVNVVEPRVASVRARMEDAPAVQLVGIGAALLAHGDVGLVDGYVDGVVTALALDDLVLARVEGLACQNGQGEE